MYIYIFYFFLQKEETIVRIKTPALPSIDKVAEATNELAGYVEFVIFLIIKTRSFFLP